MLKSAARNVVADKEIPTLAVESRARVGGVKGMFSPAHSCGDRLELRRKLVAMRARAAMKVKKT